MFVVKVFDLKKQLRSPLTGRDWGCRTIPEHLILDAANLLQNRGANMEERTWNTVEDKISEDEVFRFHISRIATLYCTLKTQPFAPIDINLHVSGDRVISADIYDGQHRFAAAVLGSADFMHVRFHILTPDGAMEKILLAFPSAVAIG